MRIIGGRMRGLKLAAVGKARAGSPLRPTGDRVRESLFNLLLGGRFDDPVTGARVLDLFAGTGALGLEALSRGATCATFVENGRRASKILQENIARAEVEKETRLVRGDVTRLASATGDPATLVFLDPPFRRGLGGPALVAARSGGWIADGALIAWEEADEVTPPPGIAVLDFRRYGGTCLTLCRMDAPGA
ncbi:MAG: 16S rRNA (guanine(966)-N(2))-methyltransferase RsmD [Boseongicola sp. SB0675_bin_26]|nr:16S rRNA (guanine(966)-N(2))-methyltransferase RsmD [Boseongicola sp. SB0675_bin_26]